MGLEAHVRPKVMLLDGDYTHALAVAGELWHDLSAVIIGVCEDGDGALCRSRYCRAVEFAPPPASGEYPAALLDLAWKHRPDMVLPVGCHSVRALAAIRQQLPASVGYCLPPSDALETALDKHQTLRVARAMGIQVPADYTDLINEAGAGGHHADALDRLTFPLFLKAAYEAGKTISARVEAASAFWAAYDALRQEAPGGDVLVQECIDGDAHTYACGLLFLDGQVALSFGHDEMRSVPRRGGSGTRLRTLDDPGLTETSVRLLQALHWNGLALVEYKRHRDGSLVLMEVNPKFWASYALASRCGFRFASAMVSWVCNLPAPARLSRHWPQEMVFPLREIAYCLRNREQEPILGSLAAMLWPPASWDLDLSDLRAWLPYAPLRKLAAALRGSGRA